MVAPHQTEVPMPPTPTTQDTQAAGLRQAEFQTLLHEKLRQAVRLTLMAVLDDEITAYIGAGRYERGGARRDQRNGTYTRDLGTTAGVIEALPVPRTRHGFRTQVFERYQRRQAELDTALAELFIGGVSQAQVGQIIGRMTDTTGQASKHRFWRRWAFGRTAPAKSWRSPPAKVRTRRFGKTCLPT